MTSTFIGLLRRDLLVIFRDFYNTFFRVMIQPLFYLIVFILLAPLSKMGISKEYAKILVPGNIALVMTMVGFQGMMSLAVDFFHEKTIEYKALLPISPVWIGIEKVIIGMIQALLASSVIIPYAYLILGSDFTNYFAIDWGWLILIALLSAIYSAFFGLLMGSIVDPAQSAFIITIAVVPLITLGGVYFTWESLTPYPALKYIILLNPLIYSTEGIRQALVSGVKSMPQYLQLLGLTISILIAAILGLKIFSKRIYG